MMDLNLPEINRKLVAEKKKDKKEFKGLFETDSEDDEEGPVFKIKGTVFYLGGLLRVLNFTLPLILV